MTTRLNMTKAAIEALTIPGTYYDTKQPGLVLNVSPKGHKAWGIYKWKPKQGSVKGRPVSQAIGPWPAFGVDLARSKARELVHALDRGEAPTAPKAKVTLGDLDRRYELALKATGAKDPARVADILRLGCDDWRDREATGITRDEAEQRHNEIAATRGPMAALLTVKALKSIYKHAELPCPAAKVRVSSSKTRTRVATKDELAAIKAEVAKQDPYWRDYFMLSILTGARRDNVASMRFDDVKNGVWTIPADDAKMGEPITLPLVAEAIEIIEARRKVQGSGYVFPANNMYGRLHSTWEKWNQIRIAAGAPDVTQHDLRRTLISRLAEAGVNPAVAAKVAGHRSVVTTLKVYTSVRQDQVLDALNKLGGA